MYDLIIIGSGPAGLSAAVYGMRAGLELLVIEQSAASGGQILNTYEVDNYPGLPMVSGAELAKAFRAHADGLGAAFVSARVKEIKDHGSFKTVHTRRETYETRAVILATGARHATLDVPGEDAFTGMGVSYCATCDGAFYKDKTVAVVGGGDVALEDAIYLARACRKVYVIHRRGEFRGTKLLQERLLALPNVEILYHHIVKEIQGAEQVEALVLGGTAGQNADGGQAKEPGETRLLAVDGVFIAVGIRPESGLVADLAETDEDGYVIAGEDCVSSCPGIFAAGDVRRKNLRQVVTAVADGANSVVSADKFLRNLK